MKIKWPRPSHLFLDLSFVTCVQCPAWGRVLQPLGQSPPPIWPARDRGWPLLIWQLPVTYDTEGSIMSTLIHKPDSYGGFITRAESIKAFPILRARELPGFVFHGCVNIFNSSTIPRFGDWSTHRESSSANYLLNNSLTIFCKTVLSYKGWIESSDSWLVCNKM